MQVSNIQYHHQKDKKEDKINNHKKQDKIIINKKKEDQITINMNQNEKNEKLIVCINNI